MTLTTSGGGAPSTITSNSSTRGRQVNWCFVYNVVMPSLSDHIEHLTTTARAIRASAAAIIPDQDNPSAQTGPFTRAVLDTALGDLIRDIDASELGLFTLIPTNLDVRKQPENGARKGEISRVGFPGATPLRKIPTKRSEMLKPKEFEPEVYARAALKYLDR